ncbi:Uncharacterized protein FWK35_00005448 [Aphis craccivora]|uniref:C2H2-type domain-containing protein n=1 Tax=Aphis craccivora TaxID=307492 RepID=A0A6G0Z0Q6_APHCR|nr:Uncharacterized protein FWK35_00005448 [Aphis craccivora]
MIRILDILIEIYIFITTFIMTTNINTAVSTRQMTHVWLIGQMSQHLSETKLPSRKEVMSLFFYHKNIIKINVRDSARVTAVYVMTIWDNARIPTVQRSEGLKEKENNWQKNLDKLFDIAHADALNTIRILEDKEFLLLQRKEGRLVEFPHSYIRCVCYTKNMLNLKSHTSTHTGENSYKCDVCYKIFTRTNYLIKHMRIHSGKKALKCETCAKDKM